MSQVLEKLGKKSEEEQRILLSGMRWRQYEAVRAILYDVPGIRTAYLDGNVEVLTLSKKHEKIKSNISRLLDTYLDEVGIEFYRTGSFTMGGEDKNASAEPDESYSLDEEKTVPDLVIEVIITSGKLKRREIFRRLGVAEAWYWKDEQLLIYNLRSPSDEHITQSVLLPKLDIDLFIRCVNMLDQKVAVKEFRNTIRATQ
jgi:Uma2 family endonuclease